MKKNIIISILFTLFISSSFAQYNYATGKKESSTSESKSTVVKTKNVSTKKLRVSYDLYNTLSFTSPKNSDEPNVQRDSDFDLNLHISNSHHFELEYYLAKMFALSINYKRCNSTFDSNESIELPANGIYNTNYSTEVYDTYSFGKIKANGLGLGVKLSNVSASAWRVGLQFSFDYLFFKTELDTIVVFQPKYDVNFAGEMVYVDDKYSALMGELKFIVEKEIAQRVAIRFGAELGLVFDRLNYLSTPLSSDYLNATNYVHGESVSRLASAYYCNLFLGLGIHIF